VTSEAGDAHEPVADEEKRATVGEVFTAFLRRGLTSFGGPVAHLGYFRPEFAGGRQWLDEAAYADLVEQACRRAALLSMRLPFLKEDGTETRNSSNSSALNPACLVPPLRRTCHLAVKI
jgi:hypothetical protein